MSLVFRQDENVNACIMLETTITSDGATSADSSVITWTFTVRTRSRGCGRLADHPPGHRQHRQRHNCRVEGHESSVHHGGTRVLVFPS